MTPTVSREDEALLLDLLNTTPVVGDEVADLLGGDDEAAVWALGRGGVGSVRESASLRRARTRLQAVVRGTEPAEALMPLLEDVRLLPELVSEGFEWRLDVDPDRRLAIRAVLAWGHVHEHLPGRLRPCANDECRLFLLDRSRPNTARWCSMKVCGNRLKARRHYQRAQHAD